MKCEQTELWLDRLMDGELTDDERRALEAHGQSCPDCAEQIHAALTMKALFDDMPDEVDVPLEAQARWRGAVRAEARQKKMKRLYRWVGSAAAALLVVAGIGWALNARDIPLRSDAMKAAPVAESAAASGTDAGGAAIERAEAPDAVAKSAESIDAAAGSLEVYDEAAEAAVLSANEAAVIETDGFDGEAAYEADASAPMREIRLTVEDVDAASNVICDLVQEYDGTADAQRTDAGANLYIELPAENVAEFISAIAHLDAAGELADVGEEIEAGTASLLLVLES